MSNHNIVLNTVIQRNERKFLANKLGNEMVMMNLESGDFNSMNSVGADIWEMCAAPMIVNDIAAQLLMQYNISKEQCVQETILFLQQSMQQDMFLIIHPDQL